MFTGIVEKVVTVVESTVRDEITTLVLGRPADWQLSIGQSIAVNGVCLTVVTYDEQSFTVEMIQETLDKTTFGTAIPQSVNIERTMKADGRFDGHIVQGHVDTVGTVSDVVKGKESMTITIAHNSAQAKFLVEKGSITVDGVSLTVVDAQPDHFSVCIIPHTMENTTLGSLQNGDVVNLEFDIVGKYILNTVKK